MKLCKCLICEYNKKLSVGNTGFCDRKFCKPKPRNDMRSNVKEHPVKKVGARQIQMRSDSSVALYPNTSG